MLFWIGVYTLTHTAYRDQHCTVVAYIHTITLCTKHTGSKQCVFSSMHFIASKQFASHKSKIMLLRFLEGEQKYVYIKIDIVCVHVQSFFRSLCSNWHRPPKGAIPAFMPYLRIRKPAVYGAKGRYAESSYERVCRFYEMIPRSTRHSVRHLTYEDKWKAELDPSLCTPLHILGSGQNTRTHP